MDTMSSTGIGNWHEERYICPLVTRKLKCCHHEECNKRVHRRCQEDWLDRHCYPWTREDPHFCWEHNDHYLNWVRFKAGEIPRTKNGCVEGSFLNPREEPVVREHAWGQHWLYLFNRNKNFYFSTLIVMGNLSQYTWDITSATHSGETLHGSFY